MQLGLIGLGRMGGNMRDRVRAAGHEVVGYDPRPEVTDVESLQALAEALQAPRVVWVMVPSGDPTRETVRKLAEVLEPGDLVIDGGNSRYTDDGPNAALLDREGHRFRRLRGVRRDLGQGERLRPDGRRVGRAHRASHADLRRAAAGGPARGGFRARRAGRRGALREDGAQRHRVRPHAGLRRGLRADGRHRADHQRDRRDPGLVARHGRALVAAGPAGAGAQGRPGAGQAQRLRRRLGRGPLDDRGGHPARRAAAGDLRGAVRPVHLAPGVVAGDAGGGRAAPPVRRARRARRRPVRAPPASSRARARAPARRRRSEAVPACTCAVSRSPTSGPGSAPSSISSPASACSSDPTASGRRTSSRRSATWRRWGRTGSRATPRWSGAARSGRWSARRWCTRAGS